MHETAHPMAVKTLNSPSAISPRPAAKDTKDRSKRDEPSEEDDRLTPPGEPGLGPIEVPMGEQEVPAHLVDQRPAAAAPGGVAGHRAEHFAQDGDDDHDGQRELRDPVRLRAR